MPEQLTKHPDVTLQVLRSAGAKCGANAPQEILTACPPARFCKLPGGEVCIYGLADAPQMTQITAADWRSLLQTVGTAPAAPSAPGVATSAPAGASTASAVRTGAVPDAPHPGVAIASGVGLMLIGVAIGWKLRRLP